MIEVDMVKANNIYDILIEEVGCPNERHSRFSFVSWLSAPQFTTVSAPDGKIIQIEKGREFRIGCRIGFGGKFWNNNGRLYINCYPEDQTERRVEIIERVNKRLEEFYG